MIGQTIGKYRFVEQLGREGQTTIYKAIDETLGREVAVKVLNPQQADREVMQSFQAEATTLARLNHPDIVGIHEVHRTDSDLLLVMELVRGETLDQLAARTGALPPERAAYLVAQVLGALAHAHAVNVVHRNLKPSNVTVTEQGGIKVHDFGVSRVVADEQATSDGFTLGSPAYLAPEQLLGKPVDGRADLYSAGVIFYNLLTGRLPFTANTPIEMVQRQLSAEPTPAATYRPGLPGWCQAILTRALARSPEDRFPTAEAFRSTLLAAISEATESTGVFSAVRAQSAAIDSDATMVVPMTAAQASVQASSVQMPPPLSPAPEPATVGGWSPQPVSATPAGLQMASASPPMPVVPGRVASASVQPAPRASGPPAAVSPKKTQFALIGALAAAVLLVVAVIAAVVLRKPTQVVETPPAATETAVQPPAEPPAAPVAASAPTVPVPAPPAASSPVASTPPPAPATDAALPPPPAPSVAHPPVVTSIPPTATLKLDTTPLSFAAKAIVADGDKRRERDAVVVVAEGSVAVNEKGDKGKPIYALPIDGLIGLTYSRSRNPLWSSPDGPVEAMRVEGGTFGFLKGGGERHWVGLRTKDFLLVLRLEEDQVTSVTSGLEGRTGLTLERLAERKQ